MSYMNSSRVVCHILGQRTLMSKPPLIPSFPKMKCFLLTYSARPNMCRQRWKSQVCVRHRMYYLSASFRKSCDVVISKRWWHPIIITSMTSCVGLDDSINSIIEYLHNGSMSMRLIIWEDKASQDCNQRQINSYGSQKSCHSYNFPISTAMITYPQDDVFDADDATIVDKCWSENESNIVNGLIKPFLALLNKSASKNNVDQLIMKSMISFHRLGCGCCEGDHNTDCCWACGPEFQPTHTRKAV